MVVGGADVIGLGETSAHACMLGCAALSKVGFLLAGRALTDLPVAAEGVLSGFWFSCEARNAM
jgi:hypothetical protein